MNELAYLNGVFGPIAEAKVSIEDRGFQFGDAVYEVIVAYGGRLFLAEQHLRRLERSAAAILLDYDFSAKPLRPIIEEGMRRSGLSDALVYVQLTRGTASRSHAIPEGITPTLAMTFKPLPVVPDKLRRRGARVMTTPDTRWSNCYIKAVTLLPNVLARNEALQKGFDDAVFVSPEGEVRELTSANLFVVHDALIEIPRRTESILHGVTQAFILECAAAIGVRIEEGMVHVDALRRADEMFMSGTAVEVLGITSIDGQPVGDGNVGPITQRFYAEFVKRSRGLMSNSPPAQHVTA